MYDAIVVGARVAGAPAATLLARKGYRILVVDKATFPSDAIGNNLVKSPAIARLERWGLLDRLVATGCPPVRAVAVDYGDRRQTGFPPPIDGVADSYAPRRSLLDAILVDAAREAGAEVREAFAVDTILGDGERVTGIRGHAKGGATVEERARIVIGADGRNSLVARAVGAAEYNVQPPLACYHYSYWSGVPVRGLEVWYRPERVIIAVPTNDDLTCVVVGYPQREFPAFRANVEAGVEATLALAPEMAERLHAGRREERFYGAANLRNFFRKPFGPGWALVGDAGYHKDPLPAQGSSDAFRDVDLLVGAVDAGLSGRRPFEDALVEYERLRNEAAMPMYELTCQRARLEPPSPQMAALLAALEGNQPDTDRFLGLMLGTVPIAEFFAPENIERIMAAAGTGVAA